MRCWKLGNGEDSEVVHYFVRRIKDIISFSLYVSSIYNYAIAKTNTEIVMSSLSAISRERDEQFYYLDLDLLS